MTTTLTPAQTVPGSTELQPYIAVQVKRDRTNAKIVRQVVKLCKAAGNPIVSIYDGEEDTKVTTKRDVLNIVFNLDEAYLYTKSGAWIFLVFGNDDYELISDYNVSLEDTLKPINDWCMERLS